MKIGIISDSHGRTKLLRAALDELLNRDAEILVHCGDIGGPEAIEILAATELPVFIVAGNTDARFEQFEQLSDRLGVNYSSEVAEVPIGQGKFLAATHGHDQTVLCELIEDHQFPYVCHGHTHCFRDETIAGIRVINPGALHHPRNPRFPTVALLDTDTDLVERIDLDS